MSWAFVTVTFNSSAHLSRYWSDLLSDHPDIEWIVVDNASTDSSAALARDYGAQVFPLSQNHGFAYANNRGLERVESEHVLFVNPDIYVPAGADLSLLQRWEGSLVAPRLLNTDGSVQDNARGLPYLSRKVRNRLPKWVEPHPDYVRTALCSPTRIAWAMGAALGGRTDDFRAIQGWDENYFLYYEDHEIGLRAWKHGLEVVHEPAVELVHEWQRATTSLDRTAWRLELASMRTFYSAYPALLSTRARLPEALERVREAQWSLAQ